MRFFFVKSGDALIIFFMSIRLSICINSAPIGRICIKLDVGEFYDIQYVPILFRTRQNYRELCMLTYVVFCL